MNLLALDASSKAASVALLRDGALIGESYLCCGLTHSQTLMPMVENLCTLAGIAPAALGGVAVTSGPGSFTGVRIGLATAKGMAAAIGIPCAGVSTLLSLAYNVRTTDGICCSVLDARCAQVYYALFKMQNGQIRRLCADSAAPLEELIEKIVHLRHPVVLAGDGAALCMKHLPEFAKRVRMAPAHLVQQRASGAAFAALEEGVWMSAERLLPSYLRLSQAEREMLKKEEQEKTQIKSERKKTISNDL